LSSARPEKVVLEYTIKHRIIYLISLLLTIKLTKIIYFWIITFTLL